MKLRYIFYHESRARIVCKSGAEHSTKIVNHIYRQQSGILSAAIRTAEIQKHERHNKKGGKAQITNFQLR